MKTETWIPSVQYILELFNTTIDSPNLINRQGLTGTIDKVRFGHPFQKSPTIWQRVTIIFREIVENHYFMDGNKRIGSLIAFIFLEKNELGFEPPIGEIFSMTMAVAQSQKTEKEIMLWFRKNSTPIG
jgi:death-on-curing family protein